MLSIKRGLLTSRVSTQTRSWIVSHCTDRSIVGAEALVTSEARFFKSILPNLRCFWSLSADLVASSRNLWRQPCCALFQGYTTFPGIAGQRAGTTALPPLTTIIREIHSSPTRSQKAADADGRSPPSDSTHAPSEAATEQPVAATTPQIPQPAAQIKPWTFTRHLTKRKLYTKRMANMLTVLEDEKVREVMAARSIPEFFPGDSLQIRMAVPQNQRRTTVMKGLCIAKRNRGLRTSFIIRNHMGTAGGIERTFPLFSPHIESITVLARNRRRRAKLYYLRDRSPKEYRVS